MQARKRSQCVQLPTFQYRIHDAIRINAHQSVYLPSLAEDSELEKSAAKIPTDKAMALTGQMDQRVNSKQSGTWRFPPELFFGNSTIFPSCCLRQFHQIKLLSRSNPPKNTTFCIHSG
jgi:hypothetical protein